MTTKISGGAALAPIVELTDDDYAQLERSPGFGLKVSLEDGHRKDIHKALERYVQTSAAWIAKTRPTPVRKLLAPIERHARDLEEALVKVLPYASQTTSEIAAFNCIERALNKYFPVGEPDRAREFLRDLSSDCQGAIKHLPTDKGGPGKINRTKLTPLLQELRAIYLKASKQDKASVSYSKDKGYHGPFLEFVIAAFRAIKKPLKQIGEAAPPRGQLGKCIADMDKT